jgi:hypothetical protein
MTDIRNGVKVQSGTVYLSYDPRDEEKSLGIFFSTLRLSDLIGSSTSAGSQTPSGSKLASSIRSRRGSEIYNVFDPNIDSDSVVLGFYFYPPPSVIVVIEVRHRQRMTLPTPRCAQRSQTSMTPKCQPRRCALGSLAFFGR